MMLGVTTTVRYNQGWADYLRARMEGRSQRQVAARAGISQTAVGNYLLGREPDARVIPQLAEALGVSAEELHAVIQGIPTDPLQRTDLFLNGMDVLSDFTKDQIRQIVAEEVEKSRDK